MEKKVGMLSDKHRQMLLKILISSKIKLHNEWRHIAEHRFAGLQQNKVSSYLALAADIGEWSKSFSSSSVLLEKKTETKRPEINHPKWMPSELGRTARDRTPCCQIRRDSTTS